jgi:hypothetical protein
VEVQRKLLIAIRHPAHSQIIHAARVNRQKVQAKEEPLFAHEWNKEKEKGKIHLRIIKLEL